MFWSEYHANQKIGTTRPATYISDPRHSMARFYDVPCASWVCRNKTINERNSIAAILPSAFCDDHISVIRINRSQSPLPCFVCNTGLMWVCIFSFWCQQTRPKCWRAIKELRTNQPQYALGTKSGHTCWSSTLWNGMNLYCMVIWRHFCLASNTNSSHKRCHHTQNPEGTGTQLIETNSMFISIPIGLFWDNSQKIFNLQRTTFSSRFILYRSHT